MLSARRDQVYLVSLRESYRNEIIPYRVRNTHTYTYTHTRCLLLWDTRSVCVGDSRIYMCVSACERGMSVNALQSVFQCRVCVCVSSKPLTLGVCFCGSFQKLTWRSGPADREMCAVKGKHRVSSGLFTHSSHSTFTQLIPAWKSTLR